MPKLVVFDMDGVLFQHHNFWIELHKALGTWEEGKLLTQKYLHTDYEQLVKEVIGRLWDNKPARPYYDLIAQHEYVAGARETFTQIKQACIPTAIITSGPYELALRAQRELGVDHIYANRLFIQGDRIVGTTDMSLWPVLSDEKVKPLENLCHKLGIAAKDVTAVLHDTNDIKIARYIHDNGGKVLGFMYEPHEELERYCSVVVREKDLKAILPHLLEA